MFFATADCIVVKGTTLEPGMGGGAAEPAGDFGAGAGATGAGLTGGDTLLFDGAIPAAASTSAGVIRPNGPDPTTVAMSTLCCFASFLAWGVATVFLGRSETDFAGGVGGGVDSGAAGAGAAAAGAAGEGADLAALAFASATSSGESTRRPMGAPTGAVSPSGTTMAARMPS